MLLLCMRRCWWQQSTSGDAAAGNHGVQGLVSGVRYKFVDGLAVRLIAAVGMHMPTAWAACGIMQESNWVLAPIACICSMLCSAFELLTAQHPRCIGCWWRGLCLC
jgi:hypothetical protein